VEEGQWKNELIRVHDVDAKYKLFDGLVGFPTSHDITPTNLDAYIQVLKKLLAWKNEILIVSKPNINCIKRICDEATEYKDKILFRFTIGAMNDDILEFWDTNAPRYNERKESLIYAFQNGFPTSVSMEPLLDSENVVATVSDLVDYVTDSIWIGKMNYTGALRNKAKKNDDKAMQERVAAIEAGQTDDRINAVFTEFQEHPDLLKKIKWKDSYREVIEIEKATEAGMDI
jgi:DNA repair photolyase